MQTNCIAVLFVCCTAFTGIIGLLLVHLEPYVPTFVARTYRYGKFSANVRQPLIARVEVPKRWFRHFYLFAAPGSCFLFILILRKYFWNMDIPHYSIRILDTCLGSDRRPVVSAENTLLVSLLFTVHCCKRFYETRYVNVFSDRAMNISHYIVGFYHYLGTFLAIVGESQGFVQGSEGQFSWTRITYFHMVCASIVLSSSYLQYGANRILGDLRKNGENKNAYRIPHGGLFEYVSGALHITEIMIYVTLSILMWESSTFHYVTAWVVVNQTITAMLTHKWYIETFPSYPKCRKILIPRIF